jgi:hypothetical protein
MTQFSLLGARFSANNETKDETFQPDLLVVLLADENRHGTTCLLAATSRPRFYNAFVCLAF